MALGLSWLGHLSGLVVKSGDLRVDSGYGEVLDGYGYDGHGESYEDGEFGGVAVY